jgi:hypothetical protein
MKYRFRYNQKKYKLCDTIEEVDELIKLHDYFIISQIRCRNISKTDIKVGGNDMMTDVFVNESDVD